MSEQKQVQRHWNDPTKNKKKQAFLFKRKWPLSGAIRGSENVCSALYIILVTQNSKETVKGKEQMVVNAVICLSYVMMDAGVPFQMQIEMVSDLRIIFSYD